MLFIGVNQIHAQKLNLGKLKKNKGQVADMFRRGNQLFALRIEGMNAYGNFYTAGMYKVYEYDMNDINHVVSSQDISGADAKAAGFNYVFENIYSTPSGKPFVMLYSQGSKDKNAKVTVIPLTDEFKLDTKRKVDIYDSKKIKDVSVDGIVIENHHSNKYLPIHIRTSVTKKNFKASDRPDDEIVFLNDNFEVVRRSVLPHNTIKSFHRVLLVSGSDYIYSFSGDLEKEEMEDARISRFRADVEEPTEDVLINGFPSQTIGRYIANNYNDGQVVIAGTTYKGKKDVDGYFFYTINDKKGIVENNSKLEFEEEVVAKFFPAKAFAKANRSEKNPLTYRINHIAYDKKGDMFIFGERFYKILVCNKYSCYYVYYNCDIMVTKISKDGKYLWGNVVNKKVASYADGYDNGYMSAVSEKSGDVYVFYNDVAKNLPARTYEANKLVSNLKVNDLFMVKFDGETGEITKEIAHNYGKDKVKLITRGIENQGLTNKVFFYFNGAHLERIGDMELE